MYISRVTLVNYRNFKNSIFKFNKGINTIIGENGSGKTNIFKAIRLLLDDDMMKFAYKLQERDFNRSIPNWRGQWIIISIEFSDLTADESVQALFAHQTGDIRGNATERATYNLFFRPSVKIRTQLSELEPGDRAGLEALLSTITIDDYETVFTGKSTADFSDPEVVKELTGNFEAVDFNVDFDASKFGIRIPHQLAVAKSINFTFIKALRDVVSDFHNNRANPLLTLLKSKGEESDPADFRDISEAITKLNEDIENLDGVKEITGDIKTTIKEAVGETYSPSKLSIRSNLPNDPERLLQSLGLYIGEADEDYEGEIHELSLGGANLIFLTLKLLEFKAKKKHERIAHFLLIEEPEAHLHTHIQKTLFDHIKFEDTQVIYSTHSTFISEASNIDNVNILGRVKNYAEVFHPATDLASEKKMKLQRYLDAIRTNLLFAKGVILVEGDGEEILYPTLIREIFGLSLDELGISVINIGSTGFENVAQIFHPIRIRRQCAIVTDLDEAHRPFTELVDDSPEEKKKKQHLAAAEIAGARRRQALEILCNGNPHLHPFFATTTFEIELLEVGNTVEFCAVAQECYAERNWERFNRELTSEHRSIFGERALSLANELGKGWFALSFSGKITWKTFIPDYMLSALIFAKGNFSRQTISNIVSYRTKMAKSEDDELETDVLKRCTSQFIAGNATIVELRQCVDDLLQDVQLTYFLRKCEENEAVG
ncbi:ATP-dependent nuclease [Chitinophaga arvensicola]|uniref:Predicted ATP-dependent endonuclease of the OLD family, contains P-loop ATPase and TOPRIM domains n=1 Tax=Chitinophaga arvensicola TaxID=29529 RepID=A0A1I0S7G5_9BACT|nr:AAA family ATPase [Chitinophaga arvensicola]SEW51626.1 Predicted ATP-dependent endonuclease of the OLD family, contains P-loop ATPase and TOPRIM domains [Chitinophaga arvensicola]